MGTDIYGAIEIRDLTGAAALDELIGTSSDREAAWMRCMDLYPLYPGGDYSAFGCLFGIRNWNGWASVAGGRGLPADVSDAVRHEYEYAAGLDAVIGGSTWVAWPELRDLDMTVTPLARGVLVVNEDGPGLDWCYRVEDEWPAAVVARYGPPLGESPVGAAYGSWRHGSTSFTYKQVTREDVLGPGTGWEHVFAVMRCLAQRFGDEGVRLVAWFD